MHRLASVSAGIGVAMALQVTAQSAPQPHTDGARPLRGENRPQEEAVRTAAQAERVKAILSTCDAWALTADQARAIHEAFRQAGIRGGPTLNAAVKAAGIDPNRRRDLAPPPGQGGEREPRPAGREEDGAQGGAERPRPPDQGRKAAETAPAPVPQGGAQGQGGMVLRSPAVAAGGPLPVEFTGDGASATLPLEWSGMPAGTRSLAVVMHHVDPESKTKWYWILYGIPATVQSLPKNVQGVGTLGTNSVSNRLGYAPPHSKGPGAKTYVYTVYALSAPPRINVPAEQVTRDVLLDAIAGQILASAELKVVYTRAGDTRKADEDQR